MASPNIQKPNVQKTVTAAAAGISIVTSIGARDHLFICDETPQYGGDDSAPDPYDYIIGGLGACTAISLIQLAKKKNWPLERVEVHLHYTKHSSREQKTAGSPEPRPDRIQRNITLWGELTSEQKEALNRAAGCSAHNMLRRGIDIETEITAG